ncbi:hypothetical protein D3C85_1692630 [compost metagenome]
MLWVDGGQDLVEVALGVAEDDSAKVAAWLQAGLLAKETGLAREQLYKSFSEHGNPTLKTMLAVMRALGVDLTARPHAQ